MSTTHDVTTAQHGWVWIDGTIVTDPEHLAEQPARVEMRNRPPYD